MRILVKPETVAQFFDKTTVPYDYTSEDGKRVSCQMPAWMCKRCKWTSLMGINNMPFPHECDVILKLVAETDQSFEAK